MGNYFDDVILTLTAPSGTGVEVDVSCDVTAATLTPDTPEEVRKRLCGSKTLVGTTTWVLELEYDQNWSAGEAGPPVVAQGLSAYLDEHAGELADFSLEWPLEGITATGVVRLKPAAYGGTAGEVAEASVSLGLDGQPTFTPSTATAATASTDAGDRPERAEAA
jgi:hypothetical protein